MGVCFHGGDSTCENCQWLLSLSDSSPASHVYEPSASARSLTHVIESKTLEATREAAAKMRSAAVQCAQTWLCGLDSERVSVLCDALSKLPLPGDVT